MPDPYFGPLFRRHSTDKDADDGHDYGEVYDALFPTAEARAAVRHVLELGGGPSSGAWVDAFPHAERIAVADRDGGVVRHLRPPCVFRRCDLGDTEQLKRAAGWPKYNVIIDDASHRLDHQLLGLNTLRSHLTDDGIYLIEDVPDDHALSTLAASPGAIVFDRRPTRLRIDDVVVAFRGPGV